MLGIAVPPPPGVTICMYTQNISNPRSFQSSPAPLHRRILITTRCFALRNIVSFLFPTAWFLTRSLLSVSLTPISRRPIPPSPLPSLCHLGPLPHHPPIPPPPPLRVPPRHRGDDGRAAADPARPTAPAPTHTPPPWWWWWGWWGGGVVNRWYGPFG